MSRAIARNLYCFRGIGSEEKMAKRNFKILSMRDKKAKQSDSSAEESSSHRWFIVSFVLVMSISLSGAFYLYQVNDLATKGYEIRDIENHISALDKENKKMQIREVELRSMYNLEKSTKDLNLVNTTNITYLEGDNSVAMK